MPEDRALTQAALRRGYAVIAIGSQDACWDATWPPESSQDVATVLPIITQWQHKHALLALPLAALGASSGGYFVTVLAHRLKLNALAVYISSGVEAALSAEPELVEQGARFPPTLFVHMPRDKKMARRVARSVALLRARGVHAAELPCEALPVTPLFFAERILGVNTTASEKVLAHRLKLNALAVYISSGVEAALSAEPELVEQGARFPPTLFVHMPRDKKMARRVARSVALLRARGVHAAELPCEALPVTPLFFAERILGVNTTASEKIFGALKLEGLLSADNHLLRDPRRAGWVKELQAHAAVPTVASGELQWEKEISEELNVAYAMHELTSLKAAETFDWFRNKCWRRGHFSHRRCRAYDSPITST
eukprot:jgi/Mesen1/8810/ME000053S08216